MTKDEYNQRKAELIKTYGEPTSPHDEPNQARLELNKLLIEHRRSNLVKKEDKPIVQNELNVLAESIPKDKQKELRSTPALPVYLVDEDLRQFTDEQRKILLCYFEDINQPDQLIANRVGCSVQLVTRTKRLPAVSALNDRATSYLLKAENAMMIRKLQLAGDTKIIVELGKKFGNLEKDSLDITQKIKPIEDPAMIKMLKELGDKLIDGKE